MHLTRSQVVKKLTSIEDMKIRKVDRYGRKLDKIFFHGEPVGTLYADDVSLAPNIDTDECGPIGIDFRDDDASDRFDDVLSDLINSLDWAERMERLERAKNLRDYFNTRKSKKQREEQYKRIVKEKLDVYENRSWEK